MTASAYVPQTGDLIWTDFDPTKGREQAGRRLPCPPLGEDQNPTRKTRVPARGGPGSDRRLRREIKFSRNARIY